MGPIAAMGVACAALSMLTLLPALLTIFGRRAFWPFVPHSTAWMAPEGVTSGRLRRRIVDGSRLQALLPVIGACLVVLILLPLVLLNALLTWITRGLVPVADRRPARPGDLQAVRGAPLPARALRRRDARLLEAGGRLGVEEPGPDRDRLHGGPAGAVPRAHVLLDRPHDERQLPHRGRVGRGPGDPQPQLPRGRERPGGHRRARLGRRGGGVAGGRGRGRRGVRLASGCRGRAAACSSRRRSSRSRTRPRRST